MDRILVLRAEAVTKTASGLVIPEKAQSKVLKATVVAVGPGARNQVISSYSCEIEFINIEFFIYRLDRISQWE